MTKKLTFIVLLGTSLLFFQSCTVAKISGKGSVPILLNQPDEKMELIEHVKITKNSNFDWTSSFDASEILNKNIKVNNQKTTLIKEKNSDVIINTTVTKNQALITFL